MAAKAHSALYSVHCLHITAHFSNIVVSAQFSKVSLKFSKINTSLISVSAYS